MNYYYNDYSNPQKNLIESCCQLIKYIREANMWPLALDSNMKDLLTLSFYLFAFAKEFGFLFFIRVENGIWMQIDAFVAKFELFLFKTYISGLPLLLIGGELYGWQ